MLNTKESIDPSRTVYSEFSNSCGQLVFESKEAMIKMPNGKNGIVIGSGRNTPLWHIKGWETLDINPEYRTKYVGDANQLSKIIPSESYDYILSEYVGISTRSQDLLFDALGHKNILAQAMKVLRDDGIVIIQTADSEMKKSEFRLGLVEYAQLMGDFGFSVVLETENMTQLADRVPVVWYGRKNK